ncbi:bifunctional lysylphosphatidylglycerol flippase/synthetase MprF [Pseudonocardia petroleophila]|uniref:bifunctional lysylphosphatidylglycerol flippase/synthetase MprF n=1 Tax=Pseudonocardia petroleophila TaxID=37331 RepID=UPI001C8C43B2|nr:DUF2156 domain-containing protein [Pseudonocardia petroleophila]
MRDDRTAVATGAAVDRVLPRAGRRIRRAASARPVTVALLVALWTVGVVSGSILAGPAPNLLAGAGIGLAPVAAGRWWVVATAPFLAPDPVDYLWSSVEVAVLVGLAERVLGSARVAALAAVVQVAGGLLGLALVAGIGMLGGRWAAQLEGAVAVGPTPLALGCALAATAMLPALWRRRLRLLLLVVLAMLVLYSGLLSDVLRLSAGVVGLVVGAMWAARRRAAAAAGDRGRGAGRPAAPSRRESRVLVALVVAASAIGPLLAVLAETRVGPLSVLRYVFASPPPDVATVDQLCGDPTAVVECAQLRGRLRLSGVGPAVMSVMPVLLLLVAAEGLRRGRRAAWIAALGLNLGLAALGLLLAADTAATPVEQRVVLGPGTHLHSWVELGLPAVQPLLVAVLLVVARSRFGVRAAPGTYRRWVGRIGVAAVVTAAGYVGGSLLVAGDYVPPPSLPDLLVDLPTRYLPPGYLGELEPAFLPRGAVATLLFEWTGTVFWAVVLAAGLATFAREAPPHERGDLDRLRALLAGTSGSSLAHMTTWPGQSYLFVDDGAGRDAAAVAFRVLGGVALTTGGPVGEPRRHPAAVAAFAEECARQGWTPCLYSVDETVATAARGLGWSAVQVAEETVVPLAGLVFTGKRWQDVRTALNKAGRAGITARWLAWSDAPRWMTEQVRAVSEEWVADRGLPEMGFTLGGLDELADPAVRLMLAVDGDRTVHGVTSWMPVHRDGALVGWTLDFMRRRSERGGTVGFRGVMEFLIASTALRAQADGVEFLSLSGAPLARLDRGAQVDALQRLLDVAGRSLEPVYGFRSLLAFKAKFSPRYRPLFMAYPDPAALPAIGAAIGRAYLPDAGPRQLARLLRHVVAR